MLPEKLRENAVAASLEAADPALVLTGNTEHNELTLEVVPEKILAALRILKGQKFERLSTVTVIPWNRGSKWFITCNRFRETSTSG